ncbi:nuclear transport factor 2 [Physcomitrium patens]|uniref:Uncharacterized protein n=1 Tax=Physcomitrium patens TaxID=3218 RepID=A0A2K1ICH6_PHYPA|nr:ras GTPase-activating protein-binding protein 2-like [Physcomitrium patens]PNR26979.1 hypothetical protein PHYPA_030460 [Physcomitrium patens]|eukprot:XP_024366287.1 ras GTPase-activating protein-binding protein 2-like [Physcomitrella patens]
MANHSANAPAQIPAAAHVVGNAFVNQYYTVLHQSPQVVHRFYTDSSRLTRAEAGADGAVDTVSTQNEIHQKVMSLDYSQLKAEIKTVDSQDSLNGGVLVLVTGSLSTSSSGKRNFVQSFFLAPQEKGYFVLNDVFRYLDDATPQEKTDQPVPEPAAEQQASAPEPELVREVSPSASESETMVQEVRVHPETAGSEGEDEDGQAPVLDTTTPVIEEPESPMVQDAPSSAVNEAESGGEAPKKHSYASILRVIGTPPPKATPQAPAERPAASATASPAPATAPTQEVQEESAPVENEADGRSVYVKNLPMNTTAPELEEVLRNYGTVKPGGVNVKNQKGVCYAFVEFEEVSGAQSAIEASGVEIRGRPVYIEEKKPMGRAPRRSVDNRGERPYRSDRGEGGRGRGSYGGRNFGRGMGLESRERDGGSRGGRGSGAPRGGYPNSNGSGAAAYGGGERRGEGQRAPRRNPGAAQGGRGNGAPAAAPA